MLHRINDYCCQIQNKFNIPIHLIARKDVHIEQKGIDELLDFITLQQSLEDLPSEFWGDYKGKIEQIVLTPDFHKGSGIPIGTVVKTKGFVIPQAVGNDICCGMRLLATDATIEEIQANIKPLKQKLREIFFQGKRDIPMSPNQRESMIRNGLFGLCETFSDNANTGIWKYFDKEDQLADLSRVNDCGVFSTKGTFAFDAYIRASGKNDGRDIQIGSVGGGNHFVEIQCVDDILDGTTARIFGLNKGNVTIMAHSGSVGLGHMVGGYFAEQAISIFPDKTQHPKHGFYVLPTTGSHAKLAASYLDAMKNAANFAFANRLFLGLMVIKGMSEVFGREVQAKLIYDAPHNLIWNLENEEYIHRKGATPANGMILNDKTFPYVGRPVITPGSIGDSSYVMVGQGNKEFLQSACHGAGRILTRGKSSHIEDSLYKESMQKLHVVTPIDPESPQLKSRPDILAKYHQRMKEEAPYAYKPITPVVQSIEDANIAKRVVKLNPLLTIKG